MLRLRLQATGRKKSRAFRVVVTEGSNPIKGKFIEIIGSFIPTRKKETLQIDTDRSKYWISVGATPTDTVARILVKQGLEEASKFVKPRVMKPSRAELAAKEAEEKKKEEAQNKKEEAVKEEAKKEEEKESPKESEKKDEAEETSSKDSSES